MSRSDFQQTGHTKRLSKLGAKTHVTHGRAIAPKGSFIVGMDLPSAVSLNFGDQYLIRGESGAFADRGDSGSLVVASDGQAVGILFAKNEKGEGIVCPIDKYFSALGLSF